MSKRLLALCILLIVVIGMVSTTAAQEGAVVVVEPGDTVMLGMGTTLTMEGMAPFGIDIRRGVEIALMDRPTVTVDGVEFELGLDVQDSACLAEGGQPVANRFVSDESIVGVIGHMCTPSTMAAIQFTTRLVTLSSAPALQTQCSH
jgi:ABC-type branched-subunit amino acid transport system substrate-binding protein